MVKYLSLILFIVSYSLQSQILTLTTSSKNSVWTPTKIVKTGQPLLWEATASGMTTQTATGVPVFDLSLPRTSPVTITATSTDGTNSFTELGINSLNIMSLIITNAEFLTSLSCTDNQLKSLDITNNTKLTELFCHSNQLVELVVNKNTELTNLACFFNNISVLDLSQNTLLSKLSCSNNQLKNLDLSNNTNLTSLECDMNLLENLNVQNGNNTIIQSFKTTENTNLLCIQVDDVNYSTTTWKDIDSWTSFNVDCTFSPVVNDDAYNTFENTILTINETEGVLANDIDPKDKNLTAILETNVSHGTLSLHTDGSFGYTPDTDFFGTDSFSYQANNGEHDSNIATVTIDIIPVNKPPTTNDNFYSIPENTVLTVNASEGVLSNDTDPNDDSLTTVLESDVNNGALVLNVDGSFNYTPNTDFFGTDSFSYKANDGELDSNISNVSIEVISVNEPPVANDNFYISSENIVLSIGESEGVLSNDTDADDDFLTAILTSDVSYGDLVFNQNGAFIYTPNPGFSGLDVFIYKAFDGMVNSNEARVEITVQLGYNLIMPNGFTPNDDGVNDRFKPEFKGMQWVQMMIFDTWGNLIYTEKGASLEGWDGIVKGKKIENGNYLYKISGLTNQDKKISSEGIFTLIK